MPDFNKSPVTKGPGTENPGQTLKEPTAEQKEQVAELADTARSAAAQSMAAVTAINSLKPGVTAEGQAKLETNQEMPPSDIKTFRATASVEVRMGDIPVEENVFFLALANKNVRVTLYKDSDLIESTLFGTYEIEGGEVLLLGGQGKLEVDLPRNAWTVENIVEGRIGQRMTFEPNGSGQGAAYQVKPGAGGNPVIDYDQELVKISWGVDGRMTFIYPDGLVISGVHLFQ